ncbi:hypothetical protein HBB16_19965 [Pseudonocardia sp. MCCB 268]|nr:hypothetical protein [Pseudonocardia cytotoxica]
MTVDAEGPPGRRTPSQTPPPGLIAPSYLQAVLAAAYQDEPNSVPLTVATPAGLFGNARHPATRLRAGSASSPAPDPGTRRTRRSTRCNRMFFDYG